MEKYDRGGGLLSGWESREWGRHVVATHTLDSLQQPVRNWPGGGEEGSREGWRKGRSGERTGRRERKREGAGKRGRKLRKGCPTQPCPPLCSARAITSRCKPPPKTPALFIVFQNLYCNILPKWNLLMEYLILLSKKIKVGRGYPERTYSVAY